MVNTTISRCLRLLSAAVIGAAVLSSCADPRGFRPKKFTPSVQVKQDNPPVEVPNKDGGSGQTPPPAPGTGTPGTGTPAPGTPGTGTPAPGGVPSPTPS